MRFFPTSSRASLALRLVAFVVAFVQIVAPLAHVCHQSGHGGETAHHGAASKPAPGQPLICVCSQPQEDENSSKFAARVVPEEVQCLAKILAGTPFVVAGAASFQRVSRVESVVWTPNSRLVCSRFESGIRARGPPNSI